MDNLKESKGTQISELTIKSHIHVIATGEKCYEIIYRLFEQLSSILSVIYVSWRLGGSHEIYNLWLSCILCSLHEGRLKGNPGTNTRKNTMGFCSARVMVMETTSKKIC